MKNVWIRLVFVLCSLSALLYVAVGLACMLFNEGKVYPFSTYAAESPDSSEIFVAALAFNVGLVIALHILSFVITGKPEHIECMLAWLVPPLVIAVISFMSGKSASLGWTTAFAIPCNGLASIGLVVGTIGFVIGGVYDAYYEKLTKQP